MRCPPPAPGAASLHSPQGQRPRAERVQPTLEVLLPPAPPHEDKWRVLGPCSRQAVSCWCSASRRGWQRWGRAAAGEAGSGAARAAGGGPGAGGGQARGCGGAVAGQGVADAEALLLVRLEHVGEAEALAAHVTGVGLLAGVRAPVPLHVGPAGEALAADLADVRLLPCVGLHVLIEVLLHVEVLAAPLAHELLVADVDAHVRPQLVLVLETLVAVLASERLLPGVLQ